MDASVSYTHLDVYKRQLLKQRYKNNRLIIKAHVQGILNYKRMEKSSAVGLRNLHDTITNHLTALKNLEEPTEQWSTLLVLLVTRKLDPETRDRWETYQANPPPDITNSSHYPRRYSFPMLMTFIHYQSLIQEIREENLTQNTKKITLPR